ncbi:DUF5134 domain-containing protein [Paenarthrobacter sp. NPDC018779]|uniref:DUF5134 domain-containing protein n=1 Tax=Paenarthrobacter sp. NPDC018779 TaxID=3364375 RepID=UPI0037C8EBCB
MSVFAIPAMTWALTVVLLASGTWHTIQTLRPAHTGHPGRAGRAGQGTQLGRISARFQHSKRAQLRPSWADRTNQGLHALMHLLMAAMLWNAAPATTLVQILILAAAALWFTIQAVARPHYRTFCSGTTGRLKCTYHAATMAAAAIMIAMMTNHTTTNTQATTGSTPATAAHTHHATTTGTGTGTASVFQNTPALATLLTIAFAAAATTFLILLLRHRTQTTHTHHHPTNTRTEHGLEAAGATTMALMFATMTA